MKNLGNLLKQAQQTQSRMQDMYAKLESMEIEGSSGAGMIKVVTNGRNHILKIKIDPSLCVSEDVEILEDLIVAACKDAQNRCVNFVQEETQKLTEGLPLPDGFKLPF
jgi:DNA-binding YbaB/EbfC family protein